MRRGVIMSIHEQYAVVMTADGQFLHAPLSRATQVGDEIVFEQEYKIPRRFNPVYRYSSVAAVLLLLITTLLLFVLRDAHPVVAYVSMDINPSVEMGVDENQKVRELNALNEEGAAITSGLAYKGINIETVATSILERAKSSHYLDTPNKEIIVTGVLLNKRNVEQDYDSILAKKVEQTLVELLSLLALTKEAPGATVTTLSVPSEVRDAAAANGISSGKMAVYLMAKDEGLDLELEQLQEQSINQVTKQVGSVKSIVAGIEDTSKEKFKELAEQEKKEKKEQEKEAEKKEKQLQKEKDKAEQDERKQQNEQKKEREKKKEQQEQREKKKEEQEKRLEEQKKDKKEQDKKSREKLDKQREEKKKEEQEEKRKAEKEKEKKQNEKKEKVQEEKRKAKEGRNKEKQEDHNRSKTRSDKNKHKDKE